MSNLPCGLKVGSGLYAWEIYLSGTQKSRAKRFVCVQGGRQKDQSFPLILMPCFAIIALVKGD